MKTNEPVEIARWETTGKPFLSLIRKQNPVKNDGYWYFYMGDDMCGTFCDTVATDDQAIIQMERPWGNWGAGPVTVLKSDYPSLRRVK